MPISYIKTDKSFTQNILSEKTSKYIVESIIGLTEKMDIDSVAEGVETQVQLNCLCSLGVDYLQGGGFRQAGKCGYILL
nr:EAL domain-containing protein [Escherichia sp. E4742]